MPRDAAAVTAADGFEVDAAAVEGLVFMRLEGVGGGLEILDDLSSGSGLRGGKKASLRTEVPVGKWPVGAGMEEEVG